MLILRKSGYDEARFFVFNPHDFTITSPMPKIILFILFGGIMNHFSMGQTFGVPEGWDEKRILQALPHQGETRALLWQVKESQEEGNFGHIIQCVLVAVKLDSAGWELAFLFRHPANANDDWQLNSINFHPASAAMPGRKLESRRPYANRPTNEHVYFLFDEWEIGKSRWWRGDYRTRKWEVNEQNWKWMNGSFPDRFLEEK